MQSEGGSFWTFTGDDSAETGGKIVSLGEGVGTDGGVSGEALLPDGPKGLANSFTSRAPDELEIFEEKPSYFFLSSSPSFPLLMASMRSSSSSILWKK
jgi:hypothetical protein